MKRILIVLMLALMTAAALSETAVLPAVTETAEPSAVITVTDQNGVPVEGVMLSLCTDRICTPVYTDESGEIPLPENTEGLEVHIISAPEGYTFDADRVYTAEDLTVPIVLNRQ